RLRQHQRLLLGADRWASDRWRNSVGLLRRVHPGHPQGTQAAGTGGLRRRPDDSGSLTILKAWGGGAGMVPPPSVFNERPAPFGAAQRRSLVVVDPVDRQRH